MELALTARDIERINKAGKIAAVLDLEGLWTRFEEPEPLLCEVATLPDNRSVIGKVDRLGRVAQTGQDSNAGATIPAYIRLDDAQQAHALSLGAASTSVRVASESSTWPPCPALMILAARCTSSPT